MCDPECLSPPPPIAIAGLSVCRVRVLCAVLLPRSLRHRGDESCDVAFCTHIAIQRALAAVCVRDGS